MSLNIKTETGLDMIAGNGVAHWTGTRAEYEAQKDNIADGTYVDITDDYTIPPGGGENYSTDEQVIGTWIDGKPLYRKVIILEQALSNLPQGTFVDVPMAGNGYKLILSANYIDIRSQGFILTYPLIGNSENAGLKIANMRNSTIVSKVGDMITLEYTKTTD